MGGRAAFVWYMAGLLLGGMSRVGNVGTADGTKTSSSTLKDGVMLKTKPHKEKGSMTISSVSYTHL